MPKDPPDGGNFQMLDCIKETKLARIVGEHSGTSDIPWTQPRHSLPDYYRKQSLLTT